MPRPSACLALAGLLLLGAPAWAADAPSEDAPPAAGAATAGGLDLDAGLQEAFSHSPELARLRAAQDEQAWSRQLALAGALPHLDLDASQVLDARYSYMGVKFGGAAVAFPAAFPDSTLQARLRWTVFDGLATWQRRDAATLNTEASGLELRRAEDLLRARVTVAYDEALAAQALADVARRNVETLEAHLKVAQAGLDAGTGVQLDVLRLESQLEEAKADALAAADRSSTARRSLATAMGLADDERPLNGALPLPDPAALAALPEGDAARRPDLLALQRRVAALEADRKAGIGTWLPSVSLYAVDEFYHNTDRFDADVVADDGYKDAYQWGVRLDWSLLDGGADLAHIQMADARLEQARQRARELALAMPNELKNLREAYLNGARLYEARKRSVDKAEENVRLSRLGLNTGIRTHNEVLDAELDLFRARAGLVRVQADAAEALALLRAAQGTAKP